MVVASGIPEKEAFLIAFNSVHKVHTHSETRPRPAREPPLGTFLVCARARGCEHHKCSHQPAYPSLLHKSWDALEAVEAVMVEAVVAREAMVAGAGQDKMAQRKVKEMVKERHLAIVRKVHTHVETPLQPETGRPQGAGV